jgi:hypothetical protein
MNIVKRTSADTFRNLPLHVHSLLHDVPLQDVTVVELSGGGDGRTLADVRALMPADPTESGGSLARGLFALRGWLGRLFGWDERRQDDTVSPYRARIPAEVVRLSNVAPGATSRSGFVKLYELADESLLEVRNATVHAFLAEALRPAGEGYLLYWAVYVAPVSRLTGLYMALIEPFRRFIVYPSVLGSLSKRWRARYRRTAEPAGVR